MSKKIMIIDDNPGILFVMQQALHMKGYDVYTSDEYSGVASVVACAPDLIYLDVSLLGADGRDVSNELKSNVDTKNIPIIILTAHSNPNELAKEAGANSFLSKPFELEHLWKKTAAYV